MARYKVLKSIAHNTAHSLLSDMWWVEGGFFYEHLYDAARAANSPVVTIDLRTGVVSPPALRTLPVLEALQYLPRAFARWVQSGGAALDMVNGATVRISYDFARSPADPMTVPGRRRLYYECVAELQDDRGQTHRASVVEHWRY